MIPGNLESYLVSHTDIDSIDLFTGPILFLQGWIIPVNFGYQMRICQNMDVIPDRHGTFHSEHRGKGSVMDFGSNVRKKKTRQSDKSGNIPDIPPCDTVPVQDIFIYTSDMICIPHSGILRKTPFFQIPVQM